MHRFKISVRFPCFKNNTDISAYAGLRVDNAEKIKKWEVVQTMWVFAEKITLFCLLLCPILYCFTWMDQGRGKTFTYNYLLQNCIIVDISLLLQRGLVLQLFSKLEEALFTVSSIFQCPLLDTSSSNIYSIGALLMVCNAPQQLYTPSQNT